MTKEQLIDTLRHCASLGDVEVAHIRADEALLEYINDPDITKAFETWEKWYA